MPARIPLIEKLRSDFGLASLATIGGNASAAIMGLAAARGLAPADRGALALILSVGVCAQLVAALGLPAAVAFALARKRDRRSELAFLGARLAVRCSMVAVVIMLLGGLLLVTFTATPFSALLLFTPWVWGSSMATFAHSLAQGRGEFGSVAAFRLAIMVLPNALASVAALVTSNLLVVTLLYSVGGVAVGTAALMQLRSRSKAPRGVERGTLLAGEVKDIRRYGRGAFLGSITQQLNGRLDVVLVGLLFTTAITGSYAVALSMGQLVTPFFIAWSIVSFQRVASAESRGGSTRLAWRYWAIAGGAAVLVILAALPFVGPTLTFLYGDRFAPAVNAARILFIGTCLSGLTVVTNEVLRGLGHARRSSAGDALGVLVTFALILGFRPDNIAAVALYSSAGYLFGLIGATVALVYSAGSSPGALHPDVAHG